MTLADGMLGGIETVWTECLRMTFRLISRYVPRPRAFDKCESVSTVSHVVPAFFFFAVWVSRGNSMYLRACPLFRKVRDRRAGMSLAVCLGLNAPDLAPPLIL